jgi:O-antigen ligase/predicted negative regulator of RcsB-dependent stress response
MSRDLLTSQSWTLVLMMLVLGLVPLFDNGYRHAVMFFCYWPVALLVIWKLIRMSKEELFRKEYQLLYWLLFGFVLVSAASLFWSVGIDATLSELLKLIFYALIFWLVTENLEPPEAYRLVSLIILVATAIALAGIFFYLFVKTGRVTSTFVNANALGCYLAMALLMSLGSALSRPHKTPWVYAVIIGIALVLTGSRGALLLSLLAIFGMIYLAPAAFRLVAARKIGITLLVVTLGATVVMGVAPATSAAVKGFRLPFFTAWQDHVIRKSSFMGSSIPGRFSFWEVACRMVRARPLTGFGLGCYRLAYFGFWSGDRYYSRYTHNIYLQTAAETGLPGLCSLLAFLGALGWFAWVKRPGGEGGLFYAGPLSACFVFLTHSGLDFSWNMPANTVTFFALAGMVVVLQRGKDPETSPVRKTGFRGQAFLAGTILAGAGVLFCLGTMQFVAYRYASRGAMAELAGDRPVAINVLQKAVQIYPWRDLYYQRLSHCYLNEPTVPAQQVQALHLARRAVELSPCNYANLLGLAQLHWSTGNAREAEYNLLLAVRFGGFYPDPYVALGNLLMAKKNWEQARAVFQQGLDYAPYALATAENKENAGRLQASILLLETGLARSEKGGDAVR